MSVHCIICDYDLHGLDQRGRCPECGTLIERSLHGDLLRYADARWLAAIHRGARWVHGGVLLVLLGNALPILLLVLFLLTPGGSGSSGLAAWIAIPAAAATIVGCGVLLTGLWLISTIEPRLEAGSSTGPFVFRGLSLVVIPLIVFWLVMVPRGAIGRGAIWQDLVIACAAFVAVVAHTRMFIDHLQSMDRRCALPDEKRSALLQKYRRQGMGCAVLAVLATLLLLVGSSGRPGAAVSGYLVWVLLVWLAVLSFARGTARRIELERALAVECERLEKATKSDAPSP